MEHRLEMVKTLQEAFTALQALCPKDLTLSQKERQSLSPIGKERWLFVEQAIEQLHQHPDLLPMSTKLEKVEEEFEMHHLFVGIQQQLETIQQHLYDMRLRVSSNLYKTSLLVYKQAKIGRDQDLSGMAAVVNNLKKTLKVGKRPKKVGDANLNEYYWWFYFSSY